MAQSIPNKLNKLAYATGDNCREADGALRDLPLERVAPHEVGARERLLPTKNSVPDFEGYISCSDRPQGLRVGESA